MRYLFFCLLPTILPGQIIQLAPPQFSKGDVFFRDSTSVSLEFALDNARIHYGFEDNPTEHSRAYTIPLKINQSITIKAIACHPDFLQSSVTEKYFVAVKHVPDSMNLYRAPHENYPGKGAASLYDLKKGGTDLHDGNWLGFSGHTVIIEAFFSDKISCKQLVISTLSDYNSWILPFQNVIVEGKNKHGNWVQIGQWQAADLSKLLNPKAAYANYLNIKLKRLKTRKIRIKIKPFGNLPPGHPGAGSPAWLFLDEIVFQ